MDDKDSIGIQSIYEACYALYQDQPTPPQVTAIHKFWSGGPDPLDYISMYENCGSDISASPVHWHYITYGLSDLYGDARIHGQSSSVGPSGFGFELTIRIRRSPNESKAPLWPAMLLQSLARYLFRSQAKFMAGDHIPWGRSLEDVQQTGLCDSRICNMIVAVDPQLPRITSKYGWIDFLQIVGVCDEEMQLARVWSGLEVIAAMQRRHELGGQLLVTDMRRGETLNELDITVDLSDGSTMSGVTTEISWNSWRPVDGGMSDILDVVGESNAAQADPQTPFYGIHLSPGTLELFPARFVDGVHLYISQAAAEIMHFAIAHRLRHGRHFTFLHCRSDTAVTMVTANITGAFVTEETPFGFRGSWLQVLLNEDALDELDAHFSPLKKMHDNQLPLELTFSRLRMAVSVLSATSPDLDRPPLFAHSVQRPLD